MYCSHHPRDSWLAWQAVPMGGTALHPSRIGRLSECLPLAMDCSPLKMTRMPSGSGTVTW